MFVALMIKLFTKKSLILACDCRSWKSSAKFRVHILIEHVKSKKSLHSQYLNYKSTLPVQKTACFRPISSFRPLILQPAIYSDTFNPYTSILLPGPELQFLNGDKELGRVTEDPIEFIIPVGNKHHTKLVDLVTILTVILGTVLLAREIITS